MAKYRDLKDQRDAALARAIEAERLSMKSEVDRIINEFEQEKKRLIKESGERAERSYQMGFDDGVTELKKYITRAQVVRSES